MMKSMTGFGAATNENDSFDLFIEIKSLNAKFLELNIKMPSLFSDKEIEIRKILG